MNVIVRKAALKYLARLDKPTRERIGKAIQKLEKEPPEGDIKKLIGMDGYRLRVGSYRILFDILEDVVYVEDVVPRGQAYKQKGVN